MRSCLCWRKFKVVNEQSWHENSTNLFIWKCFLPVVWSLNEFEGWSTTSLGNRNAKEKWRLIRYHLFNIIERKAKWLRMDHEFNRPFLTTFPYVQKIVTINHGDGYQTQVINPLFYRIKLKTTWKTNLKSFNNFSHLKLFFSTKLQLCFHLCLLLYSLS